jgi:hypothetical protein
LTRHEDIGNRRLLGLLGDGLLGIGAMPQAMENRGRGRQSRIYRDPALVSHLGIAAAFLLPSQQLFG